MASNTIAALKDYNNIFMLVIKYAEEGMLKGSCGRWQHLDGWRRKSSINSHGQGREEGVNGEGRRRAGWILLVNACQAPQS